MDVLRKELNSIYEAQNLESETLDQTIVTNCKDLVKSCVIVNNDCRIITDASADTCWIFGGAFARLIGLHNDAGLFFRRVDSSDEDIVYNRIHPEDLADKRVLEYEFFKFIDKLPDNRKTEYKATCRFRIKDKNGVYIFADNSTQVIQLSPNGKIWLILCCYDFSCDQIPASGILPRIINNSTGEDVEIKLSEQRSHILTKREKEILLLIKEGKPSKHIADILSISIHTVNRHRQNILEKLCVGNSFEAVMAATAMKLF